MLSDQWQITLVTEEKWNLTVSLKKRNMLEMDLWQTPKKYIYGENYDDLGISFFIILDFY